MKPYYERDGIRVYHGDNREVVPDPLFLGLRQCVGFAVARLAQRYQIVQRVRLPVVIEKAVRTDVVNILTRRAAMLTGSIVTFTSRAALRLPVRAAPDDPFADVLRVKWSNAVVVPALARTVFALPCAVIHMPRPSLKCHPTTNAGEHDTSLLSAADEGVLAGGRTRLAPTELHSGCLDNERRTTNRARPLDERAAWWLIANAELGILGVHRSGPITVVSRPRRLHPRGVISLPQLYQIAWIHGVNGEVAA